MSRSHSSGRLTRSPLKTKRKAVAEFPDLLLSSFFDEDSEQMRQKYGLAALKVKPKPIIDFSNKVKTKRNSTDQKDQIRRTQTRKITAMKNCRIVVEKMVGFNLVVRFRGRERFKSLSLQESLELVQRYHYLHLKNYFATRVEMVNGEIRFNNKVVEYEMHELEDSRTQYKPFIMINNIEGVSIKVQLPGYEIQFTKKKYYPRATTYQLLLKQLYR